MNYETAKKLKDAGFPQKEHTLDDSTASYCLRCSYMEAYTQTQPHNGVHGLCVTLLELITACGEDFRWLKYNRHAKTFLAQGRPHPTINKDIKCTDPDPETAVARLWIALNTK